MQIDFPRVLAVKKKKCTAFLCWIHFLDALYRIYVFPFCFLNKELEAIQKSEETKFGVDKMAVSLFTILVSSLSTLSVFLVLMKLVNEKSMVFFFSF